jgi:hypothetical protein
MAVAQSVHFTCGLKVTEVINYTLETSELLVYLDFVHLAVF